jgi:uncharacterized protein YndB with AHSA1/START domain
MAEPAGETGPIVRSVEVRATPERLFALLTEPESLARWWPDVAELEPRVGGRVRMEFMGGQSVVTGRVTRYEPPRGLGFTWVRAESPDVTTEVGFTVTPLGDGRSRVEVVHAGWENAPELRPLHDAGWAHFLGCLGDLAEGRPVDKSWNRGGEP